MTDLFGVPLAIGDRVAYTVGAQGAEYMEVGTTLDINDKYSYWGGTTAVAYIRAKSGRRLTNPRFKAGLISVSPIQAQHPELFL